MSCGRTAVGAAARGCAIGGRILVVFTLPMHAATCGRCGIQRPLLVGPEATEPGPTRAEALHALARHAAWTSQGLGWLWLGLAGREECVWT